MKEIEAMTEGQFLPIVGPKKGQVLVETIREVEPHRVLEVGTLIGYSTVLIGKELGSDDHLITIEIHADEAETAEENISKTGIPPTVEVIVDDARDAIPRLEGEFDLAFIDANKGEYLDYLKLVEDKIHPGTVIVADNAGIFAGRMRDYLDYVRSSEKYESRYVSAAADGLEITTKV